MALGDTKRGNKRKAEDCGNRTASLNSQLDDVLSKASAGWKPVKVSSESELAKEFRQIKIDLMNKDDWKKRTATIIHIAGLAMGVDQRGSESLRMKFLDCMGSVRQEFTENICDLRSSLVRDSCACLVMVCDLLGSAFDTLLSYLLEPLFKQVVKSIAVMAASGNQCIISCIRRVQSDKLMLALQQNATSKADILRQRIIEYVREIVIHWTDRALNRMISKGLVDLVRSIVTDRDASCRQVARECFARLSVRCPTAVKSVIAGLDNSVRTLIQKEAKRMAEEEESSDTSPEESYTPRKKHRDVQPEYSHATPSPSPRRTRLSLRLAGKPTPTPPSPPKAATPAPPRRPKTPASATTSMRVKARPPASATGKKAGRCTLGALGSSGGFKFELPMPHSSSSVPQLIQPAAVEEIENMENRAEAHLTPLISTRKIRTPLSARAKAQQPAHPTSRNIDRVLSVLNASDGESRRAQKALLRAQQWLSSTSLEATDAERVGVALVALAGRIINEPQHGLVLELGLETLRMVVANYGQALTMETTSDIFTMLCQTYHTIYQEAVILNSKSLIESLEVTEALELVSSQISTGHDVLLLLCLQWLIERASAQQLSEDIIPVFGSLMFQAIDSEQIEQRMRGVQCVALVHSKTGEAALPTSHLEPWKQRLIGKYSTDVVVSQQAVSL